MTALSAVELERRANRAEALRAAGLNADVAAYVSVVAPVVESSPDEIVTDGVVLRRHADVWHEAPLLSVGTGHYGRRPR